MASKHVLNCTAAQLFVRVQAGGGEVRFWSVVGGVGFMWCDHTGRLVGGWEEATARGTYCVVYACGRDSDSFPTSPMRRRAAVAPDVLRARQEPAR